MKTKLLRQKILDLAIHGKLVPQDPNDEPALELLKRINPNFTPCDKGHYPTKWQVTILGDIFDHNTGKALNSSNKEGNMKSYLTTSNVYWNRFDFTNVKQMLYKDNELDKCTIKKGDLLVCEGGDIGRSAIWKYDYNICIQNHIHRLRAKGDLCVEFFYYVILYLKENNLIKGKGIGLLGLSSNVLHNIRIPLPPLAEQHRIVAEINRWFNLIDQIEKSKTNIQNCISQAKTKILNLAIHGKLVPQDPNEEPAIELLKRINPNFTPCDKGHYPQLPNTWAICKLEDIVDYEQPNAYIVNSTNYNDSYTTPVLTAGKSFILGYTNEVNCIYSKLPCIIFDDFTTDSRLVNFPFKVKSSAMKILKVKKGIEIEYVALFMSITRLIGDTHKRYWISEYSRLPVPIPPKKEQKRIVDKIKKFFSALDRIQKTLEA